MDKLSARRLVLPATFVVTTFVSAGACNREPEYCADIEKVADCDAAEGCGWSQDQDECVNTCGEIQDPVECDAIERCEWSDSINEGDTGELESCHEPFT